MQKAEEILFPEEYEVLLAIKKIHDFGLLSNIMKGYRYISEARVDIYNKHQEDLKTLKKIGSITFSVCLMVTGYVRHP